MTKRSAALGALAVLLLSACGSTDAGAAKASTNLRAEIVANSSVGGATSVTDEQAGCIADGMVERVGVGTLQDYEILDDSLSVDQGIEDVQMSAADADRVADVFLSCVDVEALVEKQFAAGGTAAALSARQQRCVSDAVTDDVIRVILAAGFQGKRNDAYDRLQEEITECAVRSQ